MKGHAKADVGLLSFRKLLAREGRKGRLFLKLPLGATMTFGHKLEQGEGEHRGEEHD